MTDFDAQTGSPFAADSLITLTHAIYALHAFTVLMGMLTPAFIVTAFLTGWPSILAVILNYLKRDETLFGIPFAMPIFLASGLWVLYRIVRGWLRLNDKLGMPIQE